MPPPLPDSSCVAMFIASPNHGERRDGRRPDMIVLHYTGMASSAEALAWLCNPAAKVSSHYFVEEDGRIIQLVPEERRAWHAGQSAWQGDADVNSASIGIEIVNSGHEGGLPPFPEAQIAAVIALCRDISARRLIPPQRVLAHSDVAPVRKCDPGEKFPWAHLHREGIGHYVEPAPVTETTNSAATTEAVQGMLASYGYDVPVSGVYCAATEAAIRAFQRHFRPARVDGLADRSTATTLRELIRALPA